MLWRRKPPDPGHLYHLVSTIDNPNTGTDTPLRFRHTIARRLRSLHHNVNVLYHCTTYHEFSSSCLLWKLQYILSRIQRLNLLSPPIMVVLGLTPRASPLSQRWPPPAPLPVGKGVYCNCSQSTRYRCDERRRERLCQNTFEDYPNRMVMELHPDWAAIAHGESARDSLEV